MRAHTIDDSVGIIAKEKAQGHVTRRDKLFLRGLQMIRVSEFLDVIRAALRGIVGDIKGLSADALNIVKKLGAAFVQGVADGNGAVDVEQE